MHRLNPWTAEQSLDELSLYSDWDAMAAMVASLRVHLFEYGTVPVWNYMFCGGRPELAAPYSWAYTWPSVFAYLLEPNAALVAAWVVLTITGLMGMWALLLRWTRCSPAAWLGAFLYAFSGCFAARFNAGHITWAFYQLVPLLMLCFEVTFARRLAGSREAGFAVLIVFVTFLFFTGALPHGLIHFYPAFLLLVLLRLVSASRSHGWRHVLHCAGPIGAAHLLGAWLAVYKLWPVISWQLQFPRTGVELESYSPLEVLWNTVRFVGSYAVPWKSREPWFEYPPWGYNAFVGPIPWLLALAAAGALVGRARRTEVGARTNTDPVAVWLGLGLLLVGTALALGNDSSFGPARLFRYFPLLDGIRAFNRYQILLVFGLVVLASDGYTRVWRRAEASRAWQGAAATLALAALGPVLAQAALLVWSVPAASHSEILASFEAARSDAPPRMLAGPRSGAGLASIGAELATIEKGYWIANCRSGLTLPEPLPAPVRNRVALSTPPPIRLLGLDRQTLTLAYAPSASGSRLHLNVRVLEGFELEPPAALLPGADPEDSGLRVPSGSTISVVARYSGPGEGAWASAAGLAAGLLLLLFWLRPRPPYSGRNETGENAGEQD